jgi:hypothetical protein
MRKEKKRKIPKPERKPNPKALFKKQWISVNNSSITGLQEEQHEHGQGKGRETKGQDEWPEDHGIRSTAKGITSLSTILAN